MNKILDGIASAIIGICATCLFVLFIYACVVKWEYVLALITAVVVFAIIFWAGYRVNKRFK